MKIKSILTAIAVALTTLVQPVLASNWTFDKNGEPTHYKGIPIPPMQTVEEARAATEKRLAAIHAEEARQAAQAAISSNQQSEIGNHQLFYTGKPYLEETGQFLFLFRHYDPELARWTTADPSGFPDGANNRIYSNSPSFEIDPFGLTNKHVAYIYAYSGIAEYDDPSAAYVNSMVGGHMGRFQEADSRNPSWQYVSDGDDIQYGSISNPSQLAAFSIFDQIYVVAHGVWENRQWTGVVRIGGMDYNPSAVSASNLADFKFCGPEGKVNADTVSGNWFYAVGPFLLE